MKKHFVLGLTIMGVLFLFSCKKKDSVTVVGKWKFEKERYRYAYTNFNQQVITKDTTIFYGVPRYLNLDGNGNFQFSCDTCSSTSETGTYLSSNNKLILTLSGASSNDTLDIETLTSSDLTLHNYWYQ